MNRSNYQMDIQNLSDSLTDSKMDLQQAVISQFTQLSEKAELQQEIWLGLNALYAMRIL